MVYLERRTSVDVLDFVSHLDMRLLGRETGPDIFDEKAPLGSFQQKPAKSPIRRGLLQVENATQLVVSLAVRFVVAGVRSLQFAQEVVDHTRRVAQQLLLVTKVRPVEPAQGRVVKVVAHHLFDLGVRVGRSQTEQGA